MEKDVEPYKEQLTQSLFDHIPVGVGSRGIIPIKASDFEQCLQYGMVGSDSLHLNVVYI